MLTGRSVQRSPEHAITVLPAAADAPVRESRGRRATAGHVQPDSTVTSVPGPNLEITIEFGRSIGATREC